ncbi:MAG: SIS domain-containing protein [Dehalococcoidia bacterium]|nr:SIS domain-containing protein [Dehalococcoidia bacterium]
MNDTERWRQEILSQLTESAVVQRRSAESCGEAILAAAALIVCSLTQGGKLMLCGNGGSAADCQHLAAELVGRMNGRQRPALAALALTTDTSALTALGNDFGYETVFQRQVEARGRPGDVVLAISTSGRSQNVLRALTAAARAGLATVGLTGDGPGPLADLTDIAIRVPSANTQRIQEAHIAIGHVICYLVERMLGAEMEEESECLISQASG